MKTTFNHCLKTILFFTAITFLSCSDEEPTYESEPYQDVEQEISIVKFETFDEFNALIDELSNISEDELEFWIEQNNPDALYHSKKNTEKLNDLPESYLAILNSENEFKIGNKTLWLYEEKLYEFEQGQNKKDLKLNVKDLKPVGEIIVKIHGNDPKTTIVGQGQLNAKYKHEFNGYQYKDCSNNLRNINAKFIYVHELMSVESGLHATARYSRLYLRVKLEWRGRKKWKPAGEPRNISVNLYLHDTKLSFYNNGIPSISLVYDPSSVNVSFDCSGDRTILLKTSDSYGIGAGSPRWIVNTTGSIAQEFHGGYYYWSHFANW
ncbi:hypothetical protein [Psychroflexus tropicus]|uniref:hypothetical protein n=1 Tax=Psychroflexus tropicus TaxID=197345 RepID=UPI000361DF96|nr:hypothetical protein [Psychroflexus tropicus]